MDEAVILDYQLTDGGWADVEFGLGRTSTKLAVSHVGDPLNALISGVLGIAGGEHQAQVSWQAKDDGHQWWGRLAWLLDREDEGVHVCVLKVRRGGGGQQGGTQVTGRCSISALCSAIAEGINNLYLRTGLRRYEELTQAPFPVDGLDRLEAIARNPAS